MATSNFPQQPAVSFPQAVDLAIFSSNQMAAVINGTATDVVLTEGGDIPSLRKALVDNFYFKSPIAWVSSGTETSFNQLRLFTSGGVSSWYYAPAATTLNPIPMTTTPVGDTNWRLYSPSGVDLTDLQTQVTAIQASDIIVKSRITALEGAWVWGGTHLLGWRKDPQGNIEQWGTSPATGATPAVITLPIPFPTAFVGIVGSQKAAAFGSGGEANTRFDTTSLSTFTIYSSSTGTFDYMWTARGY